MDIKFIINRITNLNNYIEKTNQRTDISEERKKELLETSTIPLLKHWESELQKKEND